MLSMMFAGMRMPVLAAGICGALFVMMIIPPKKRKAFFGVVFCTALVLGVFVLVFQKPLSKIPVFARTFASIQSLFSGGDASSGRTGLYKHAISLFMQHPFFGIGWGNYRNTVVGVVTQETPFDVHNIYLQLLCETGIVGCVCFAVPMVMTLVMSIRNYELLLRKKPSAKWTKLMGISCMFQLYFLLFGMTDNVLFYVFESSCYLICCSISVAYARGLAVRKARRCEKEGNL